MSGGKLSTGRTRFMKSESVGPGPSHKVKISLNNDMKTYYVLQIRKKYIINAFDFQLHEKADSSIWRSSHLGTFNSKLKQIGISHPSAGGFHAKVLDQAADKAWHIKRKDDYAEILSNPEQSKCMASVLKVSRHVT